MTQSNNISHLKIHEVLICSQDNRPPTSCTVVVTHTHTQTGIFTYPDQGILELICNGPVDSMTLDREREREKERERENDNLAES